MSTDYFGPNLTWYRVAAGLTMKELAERAGTSRANISRYEHGVVWRVSRPLIDQLCAALGVTYEQLTAEPPPEWLRPGITPQEARLPAAPADDRLARIEAQLTEFFEWAQRSEEPGTPGPSPRLFPRDARVVQNWRRAAADPSAGETWVEREASADEAVLVAIGDCLAPDIEENDVLFVRRDKVPQVGNFVVVAVHGELHLKQVLQRTDSTLYLSSKRGELVLPDEGAELLGVIVRITQDKPRRDRDMSNPGTLTRSHGRLKTLPAPWTANDEGDD